MNKIHSSITPSPTVKEFRKSANTLLIMGTNRVSCFFLTRRIFMRPPFCRKPAKFDVWEGACILGSATPRIPIERSSRASQFWGSPVFVLTSLTQNDQIRHGNTYEEGCVFKRSASLCSCTNASRGLSAVAECIVVTTLYLITLQGRLRT